MDDSEAERPNLKYTRHAAERKEQRGISQSSINAALQQGLQVGAEEANIYYDEDTKVVCSNRDNSIVTVNKNTRNTRFKLSERTTEKLKSLQFKADVKHNNSAMCELGELYLSGELGERDVKKAVELFKRAASKGNSHAMCKLSEIYENGYLGARNQEEADKWMQRAADRNNVYASAIIGQRLLSKYLEKYPADSKIFRPSAPKKEIIYYFNKAVYKGSTRAMWHLGYIFEEGLLGEKDLTKAMEFYVKAARLGSPTSLKSLHKLTLDCYFSAKELEEILEYIHPNLVKSSIGMACELGDEQHSGDLGFNPVRGLKMLEQVALKQETDAIELVALSYQEGKACRTNLKLAQYWFTKLAELYDESAKAGNLHSLWELGECYANGIIGDFNLEKAEECFKMVVERSSSPEFMHQLGSKYLTGKLGDRPFETGVQLIARAIKLWESEANQQIPTAASNLGTLYCNTFCYKNGIHWLFETGTKRSLLRIVDVFVHHSCHEKSLHGLEILKGLILKQDVDPLDAFESSNLLEDTLIDRKVVLFLEDIADTLSEPAPAKNSNQYKFRKFAVSTLVKVYKIGSLGEKDYQKASKYLCQLFIDFEEISAGNQLIWLHIKQRLPEEYHDCAKNWALQIPNLLMTSTSDLDWFTDSIVLLSKLYQKTDLLDLNTKEAVKWLYVASYFNSKHVKCDLKKLEPKLEYNQKEDIIFELSKMAQTLKISSPSNYKKFSKILGDIWYDKKFINQNIDKAIFWYSESSAKNNSRASLALGKIYHHDKQDLNAATEWYMLSAQQGNVTALKKLKSIRTDVNSDKLSIFLSKYQHHSAVDKSEWEKAIPLMNLKKYPRTASEQYELGKRYLGINKNPTEVDARRAAYWFRESKNEDNIEAALELYKMYKSGIMGKNVSSVADYLYADILLLCHSCLKKCLLKMDLNDRESIVEELNSISTLLKIGPSLFSSSDVVKIVDQLISQTDDINVETLSNVATSLNQLRLEFCASNIESVISKAVTDLKLSEESSAPL